jgi:hypothetical protein
MTNKLISCLSENQGIYVQKVLLHSAYICVLGTLLYDKGISEQKRSFQNVNLNVSQQHKKQLIKRKR